MAVILSFKKRMLRAWCMVSLLLLLGGTVAGKEAEQVDVVKRNVQNITDQIASTAQEIGNKVADGATTGAQAVAEGATTGAQAVADGVNTAVDQLTNKALTHVTPVIAILISLLSYVVIHAC
eukprot:jgi/Picsp_1/5179/NSC_02542-R1_---NA---